VTGMFSRPRFILFMGTNQSTFGSVLTGANLGGFFGFASNDAFGSEAIVNYCESSIVANGGCSNLSANACYAQSSSGSFGTNTLYQGSVTSFNENGFTIAFPTSSPGHTVFYMAFCGGDGSHSLLYERSCDGVLLTDITVEPSIVVAVGQWRDTCHTLPKSTSTLPWYTHGMADVVGGSGILGAEWIYQTYSRNTLTQRWTNGVNQPGTNAILSGEHRPAPFNTAIGLGYLEANRLGTTLQLQGQIGGHDYAIGVLSEACQRMECGAVAAGTPGTTQNFTLSEIQVIPEAVVFINMESQPMVAANTPGRMGFGFSGLDTSFNQIDVGFLIDRSAGAMYQSGGRSWIPSVTSTQFSAGTVDFTPSSGHIGFTTQENDAGPGVSGWGGIRTYCDVTAPVEVALDPLNSLQWIGTWHVSRGGIPNSVPG
jgi:hypothetical protein